MSSSPAMVDAPHHPPEGAFSQSADDLICNTAQRQEGEERESGDKKGKRELAVWTQSSGEHNTTVQDRRINASAHPLFNWLPIKCVRLIYGN